ncbi:hypothetical protein WHR41_00296 [Cladosporium halotolerans]|uniref:Uncharacterized protein n=1 Tax=Cladosporium halotolerans TaxID=1052096 RepID=A0AB34L876_9PEZI
MSLKQRRPSAPVLHHNPSSSFSTVSSAASATSFGSVRSGGSRLLFGEIDTASDRSSETIASVCSLVLSDSSTFLRFWLTDPCRDQFMSHLPKQDLANMRLVCHDFSVRAAPALFEDLSVTFKPSTFTKPARVAALDRVGFFVKHLNFNIPHTQETSLPPLIHPDTGEELNFTYTPQVDTISQQAKYDDEDVTALLLHQYPPIFHAATNVPAFVRGISCLPNLTHLEIACPGAASSHQCRRSTVDYALASLRIAVERTGLNALDTLTISPIHPAGLLALSPLTGPGATPSSSKRWASIKHLSITTSTAPQPATASPRLLTPYLTAFQPTLQTLHLTFTGPKGPLPFPPKTTPHSHRTLHFPHLTTLHLTNASTTAPALRSLATAHARSLHTLALTDVELSHGSWEEAFAPLTKPLPRPPRSERRSRRGRAGEAEGEGEIPIMFSPAPARAPAGAVSPRGSPGRARGLEGRVHPAVRVEREVEIEGRGGRGLQGVASPKGTIVVETERGGEVVGRKERRGRGLLGRVLGGLRRIGG